MSRVRPWLNLPYLIRRIIVDAFLATFITCFIVKLNKCNSMKEIEDRWKFGDHIAVYDYNIMG